MRASRAVVHLVAAFAAFAVFVVFVVACGGGGGIAAAPDGAGTPTDLGTTYAELAATCP